MKAYHNRKMTRGLAATLLSGLLLTACSVDELPDENPGNAGGMYSDQICFGASTDAAVQTRGQASGDRQLVLRSADSADTLCLRARVTDGIHLPADRQTTVTRATPVTAMYDAFHVLAYWKKDGQLVDGQFYMDVDVSETGDNVWTSSETYFWPGEGHTLQFYAWAPANAFSSDSRPSDPTSTKLTYTVPAEVANQHDLLVATTDELQGDYNTRVPLTFRHICTAVRFETGSQMQAGSIKSVALKGIPSAGSYDMATGTWTLTSGITTDFTQTLNCQTTGTETAGTEITQASETFMMLPQTLPDGATVEVVFTDAATGTARTLSASLSGMEWPQGQTVTYRISITPEYEFKLSDEKILDAHYEIYKTNLEVSGLANGQPWTISATDNVTIMAQSEMNTYAQQGYWTDRNVDSSGDDTGSARGESSYNGTGNGTFPIAIFVPENTGNDTRTLNLTVTVNGQTVQSIPIEQLAPSWFADGLGCERLEGPEEPWGFYWTENFSISYDLKACDDNIRNSIRQYVEWTKTLHNLQHLPFIGNIITWIFGENIPDLRFVEMDKSGDFLGFGGKADNITINLGELNTGDLALSPDDGQQNTQDIYNFEGIQFVNEIINMVNNIPDVRVTITGEGVFPTENASIACMKLNSWNIIEVNSQTMLTLTDNSNKANWYLPACNEVNGINDSNYPLSGNYWTSTAIKDNNQQAYKCSAGGTISPERRNSELHVRAVRKRPTNP